MKMTINHMIGLVAVCFLIGLLVAQILRGDITSTLLFILLAVSNWIIYNRLAAIRTDLDIAHTVLRSHSIILHPEENDRSTD